MKNLQSIMSGLIYFQLSFSMIFLAFVLYTFKVSDTIDVVFLTNLNALFLYMLTCCAHCHFSEYIASRVTGLGSILYESSLWLRMSIEEQKVVWLMIVRSQNSFHLSGFGIIECSLSTFLVVIQHTQQIAATCAFVITSNFIFDRLQKRHFHISYCSIDSKWWIGSSCHGMSTMTLDCLSIQLPKDQSYVRGILRMLTLFDVDTVCFIV